MARLTRPEIVLKLKETGILPLFFSPDLETCKSVARACYNGGFRMLEFTNRGDFAHEIFSELNKFAQAELKDMVLGAGSVMDGGTASMYIQAGAGFIVSPVLKEDMAIVCNRRKILWIPGCGSATEISRAEELGAEIIKIFPAPSVGGPDFVKSVKGPMPWTSIMPTGGVEPTDENLKKWFDAGAFCVGMGSNLISSEILKNKSWDILELNAREVLNIAKRVRKQQS